MAVALPDPPTPQSGADSASESFRPIARLLGGVWAVESVKTVKLSIEAGHVHLWVLMRENVPDDEARIWHSERDYRIAVEPAAFDLHLFALSEIDEAVLPPAETIFER